MKMVISLFTIVSICLFLTFEVYGEDSNLLVEFTYKGKKISVQGKKTDNDTYIFNKGAKKKIWITTLDWTPYIGQNICKQGWVQQFAIALFVSQGYEVKSTFFPWARTIITAERGNADVLYPEWYIESTAPSDAVKGKKRWDNLALSERFPGGPIAFMKMKGTSSKYNGDMISMKRESIAVVRGYQHTPEFDSLMDKGFFDIHKVVDDLMQAKVLWKKRVNFLINDPFVVKYTVANSNLSRKQKRDILNSIEIVKPIIQYNYLYFAVSKKKPGWQHTLDIVNQTVQEFESTGILFDIIKNTLKDCNLKMEETFTPYKNAQP